MADRQPPHERESQAQNIRSTRVKRRRGRRDRFTTVSWCQSAMISRCSEARERTVNRSEWSSETTTDDTTAGYRRTPATSIDAMLTMFLVGTGELFTIVHERQTGRSDNSCDRCLLHQRARTGQPLRKASPETTPSSIDEGQGLLLHLRGNDATFAVSFATATVSAMRDPAGTRAVEEIDSASAWSASPSCLRASR